MELHIFFKKLIHLAFDGVFFPCLHECRSVIKSGHCIEILMGAGVDADTPEVGVKDVLSVASVGNAVIDNQLKNNIQRVLAVEGQILSIACHNLAILL